MKREIWVCDGCGTTTPAMYQGGMPYSETVLDGSAGWATFRRMKHSNEQLWCPECADAASAAVKIVRT